VFNFLPSYVAAGPASSDTAIGRDQITIHGVNSRVWVKVDPRRNIPDSSCETTDRDTGIRKQEQEHHSSPIANQPTEVKSRTTKPRNQESKNPRPTMSSSTSTLKARHYAALSSSLRRLRDDLGESEIQMVRLADHLKSMQSMGTYSAAQ